MARRVAQLHFSDGHVAVVVVPDADAGVVRYGRRRFEKDDTSTEAMPVYREIVRKTAPDPHESWV